MLDIRQIVGAILLFANGVNKILTESKNFYELKNKQTGETKFFLDELLGLPAREKITPEETYDKVCEAIL